MRSIMLKEVPVYNGGDLSAPKEESELAATEPEPPDIPEPQRIETRRPNHKRKRADNDYAAKFLVNDHSKNRVSANISRDLFNRIKQYLSLVAPDITLTSYLNNIIAEHLDTHWDQIGELIKRNLKNIYDNGE